MKIMNQYHKVDNGCYSGLDSSEYAQEGEGIFERVQRERKEKEIKNGTNNTESGKTDKNDTSL